MSTTSKPNRITRSVEFERVYRHGRSAQTRHLVLYCLNRPEEVDRSMGEASHRFGFTVSKKIGNAVTRNTVKRHFREVVSQISEELDSSRDYVLIARKGLPEMIEKNDQIWLKERIIELLEDIKRRENKARKK